MPQPAQEFVNMKDVFDVFDSIIEEMLLQNPKIKEPAFTLATKLVDLFSEASAPIGVVALALVLILRYSIDYAEEQYDVALKARSRSIQ